MTIDLIIPTFNSQHLKDCLRSILANTDSDSYGRIIVVNNGTALEGIANPRILVLNQTQNLGYERGIEAGVIASDAEKVLFLNDDTFIPPMQTSWLTILSSHFRDPKIGAVAPCSNQVMGYQNIFAFVRGLVIDVPFLTGFCLLVRRSDFLSLNMFDGVPVNSGADIDLSFRLKRKGLSLLIDRRIFVYHYGGETGKRVYGSRYDSDQMASDVQTYLTSRHGESGIASNYLNPSYVVVVA